METLLEIIKNISSALGLILSVSSVIALMSKRAKIAIGNFFKKYGNDDDISEIKKALQEVKTDLKTIHEANAITVDFTREQCRNMITSMFYRYCDTEKLPLYEYKLLLLLEDFYVKRLHGNTFIVGIIKKMKTWEIDYSKAHIEDGDC